MESHGAEVGHHARSVDLKQGRRTLRGLLLPLLNLVPFFCQMQYICSVNCRHQQLMVFHYVHLTLKPRGRLEDTATSHLSALLPAMERVVFHKATTQTWSWSFHLNWPMCKSRYIMIVISKSNMLTSFLNRYSREKSLMTGELLKNTSCSIKEN